ncbi:MAG: hypothetical protein SGJ07_10700 [Rhodospirillaceae bacterium]|nr:hypothetical protein [Rhodospirillaceae bacterium]
MKKIVLATVMALAVSLPAYAAHCPMDMADIDAALAMSPDLTAEQLAEVGRLRAEGEALHTAGDHDSSVAALSQAKAILGIE